MKQHQIVSLLAALLLLGSSDSFSPRPIRSFSRAPLPLKYSSSDVSERSSLVDNTLQDASTTYSDVAEHIAMDAQDNVQLYDSSSSRSAASRKAWQSLIPLIPGERGVDVTVKWSSPEIGSKTMLQHLFPGEQQQMSLLQRQLQESFETFQSLLAPCSEYKARIVATRGPSGTKCPRYHVDHVPMRWIQSLVGPGCDYVDGIDGIRWDLINGLEQVKSEEANLELVDESSANVKQAKEGQGVVLWGAENEDGKFPAVHKSPTLGPFQGRVLLTIDIVRE